jgi:hypothetical protein
VRLEILRDGRLFGATLRLPAAAEGSSAAPAASPTSHSDASASGAGAAAKRARPRYSVGGMGVDYRDR